MSMSNKRFFWNVLRLALGVGFAILVVPTLIGVLGVGLRCGLVGGGTTEPPSAEPPAPFRPLIDGDLTALRPEDQTFLTLPEWYIVYSADEYAAFIADQPPSAFPYARAILQFWGSYYDVCAITRDRYTFNADYHLVLVVIGASFTVENTVRGIYENTVGRLTELVSGGGQTAEDDYARRVAREYGTFLHTVPWYAFPFGEKLDGLWSSSSAWGPNIVRKWERRFALSAEYGIKGMYAALIGQGTRSVYAADEHTLLAWVRGDATAFDGEPDARVLATSGADMLVSLPRYEAFTQLVPRLARRGVEFVQIAGNERILVTVLAPTAAAGDIDGSLVTTMPILTVPGEQRVAFEVPVASLSQVLRSLADGELRLEHVYDY